MKRIFIFILSITFILMLCNCSVDKTDFQKEQLISEISNSVKKIENRNIIIEELRAEFKKTGKAENNANIIEETAEFLENPEPKLEEIAESDNGINQLILVKTLVNNDMENMEEAMGNVSQEMLQMWLEQKQYIDQTNSKNLINLIKTSSKSTPNEDPKYLINDSDVSYSQTMAGIATAGAITALTGTLFPCLKALIPIGTAVFIGASMSFIGIYAVKPYLGRPTIEYIINAIKSEKYFNSTELHAYMLANWCSNEVTLYRWDNFVGAWASPLCIFFGKDIIKWVFDWFKEKLFKSDANQLDSKKFYYLLKTLKSRN